MATNMLSKKRTKYVKVKELAEELGVSLTQIYRFCKLDEMQPAILKVGENAIRINEEKFFEILQKIYR